MKNKIYIILATLFLYTLPGISFGQLSLLRAQMEGKETLDQVMTTVDEYLKTLPEGNERDRLEKHFARWAFYRGMHLGPKGEFVNIAEKTMQASSQQSDAPLTSANGSWTFIGPNTATLNNPNADLLGNGRVDRIAFHPTDPNTIYVGTPAGGLWRSTNGGFNWSPISSYIPSLGISGIVISHADPNTIFVLTGDGDAKIGGGLVELAGYLQLSVGVLVSHDAGATWEQTGAFPVAGDFVGYRLAQNPVNASILIAATSAGIFRTTNGGTTWVLEQSGKYFDIEFKPGSSTTVYASGAGSFAYSTDAGNTWNTGATFNFPLCAGGRCELAVTPNSVNKVYLFAGPATNFETNICGFYVSTNSGLSFTRLTNTPNILGDESGTSGDQSDYDMGVTVKPSDNQKVLVCGLVTWKSTNGGSTFTDATTYRESGGNYIHPDCHDVQYNPLNDYVYAATDGGFYRSTNDGATWTNLMAGINTAQFYHMADFDANANAILAGAQDNGVKYRTANTSTFSQVYCCDGAEGVIDYTDQAKGYAVVNKGIKRFDNFTTTGPFTVASSSFFPMLELNSSDPDVLYYSFAQIMKYVRSTNTITTFAPAAFPGAWALRTCPSNSARVYAAGGTSYYSSTGDLYITSNSGANWTTISNNPGFPATFPRISDIGVRPVNSPQVFVTFSGYTDGLKVLYSGDAGLNWTNISYDLPNVPIWSIEVDDNNNAYIGSDMGVYYKASGATKWEPFYNFLPNVPVSDLEINQGADQLLAATFGRGIWRSSLRDVCPVDLVLSSNVSGQYFRSASNSITMSGKVTGGDGASAVLRSGNYIDLTTGFQANSDPGSKFLAYNGPCDAGLPPVFAPAGTMAYPAELGTYQMDMTRNQGTLEVMNGIGGRKEVVVRIFADENANARVLLAAPDGTFLGDVATFKGGKGKYTYPVNTTDLKNGMYFLYLIVNNKVVHLQEVEI
ncbi:MAG: hypothetical protein NT040_01110 [Bacteroidetes bacterium]|nr:hypothetical protein [Bacteroidota bacterium]